MQEVGVIAYEVLWGAASGSIRKKQTNLRKTYMEKKGTNEKEKKCIIVGHLLEKEKQGREKIVLLVTFF